jgi:UDP-glucose 4-epimerase
MSRQLVGWFGRKLAQQVSPLYQTGESGEQIRPAHFRVMLWIASELRTTRTALVSQARVCYGNNMRWCLVTGGAGFLGSHLVEALLERGYRVRVLDDFSSGKRENLAPFQSQIELQVGSVTDVTAVESAIRGCELVFHLAAIASVQRSLEDPLQTHAVCATGTLQVLQAARHLGVRRVVYAGSSSCYGDQSDKLSGETATASLRPCREDDPLRPLSPYAAAKLAGEMYCRAFSQAFGLETVVLRFFNIYGPRQDAKSPYSGVIALFANAMLQGQSPTIYGDGLQSRDFVFVADAVQALLLAAETPSARGQVYNIGTGQATTVLALVEHFNRLLGTNIVARHGPPRPGDVRHSLADITRARRELRYQPRTPLPEGLRLTLDWLRACPEVTAQTP